MIFRLSSGHGLRFWYLLVLLAWLCLAVPLMLIAQAFGGDFTYVLVPDIEWGPDFPVTLATSLLCWSTLLLAPWGVVRTRKEGN